MSDRIIILSDGTGNAASSVWRTNVWRIFQTLDLRDDNQAAKYDDGVGTSAFLPLALIGGAFGWGLKRNILDAYKFLCRNYQSNSKIYLFGFSRGAFTVRVLAAFVLEQGLVKADSESELHDLACKAYRAYRSNGYHSIWRIEVPFRAVRDGLVKIADGILRRTSLQDAKKDMVGSIEFIGVWDTVAAYGFPIDEMTRGVSNWIWPLELPNRVLNPKVHFARHALALDDERTTFHPLLWTEHRPGDPAPPIPATIKGQRLVQVWFMGMHSNVGGGYPDDAVAFVPLYWLLNEARDRGLDFKIEPHADPDTFKWVDMGRDKDGRLYDSRSGLGAYYRYGPRKVFELCNDASVGVSVPMPKIHESVFGRIDSGCNAYAPIGLPKEYATVTDSGDVLSPAQNPFETPHQAEARHKAQDRLWNYVWLRRLAYFATLAATLHLVAFWLFHPQNSEHEFNSRFRMVSEFVRFVESFLPHSLHWWTDWYAGNPEWFAGGIIVLALLMAIGTSLSGTIQDSMRIIWQSHGARHPVADNAIQDRIYKFRNNAVYKWFIRTGRLYVVPFLLAFALLGIGLTAASHFAFNVADSMGAFCKGAPRPLVAVNTGQPQSASIDFDTTALCAPTGLAVRAGYKYEITMTIVDPWLDASTPTDPVGYRTSSTPLPGRLVLYSGIFLRRVMFRPWFRMIVRIGETGVDEYFLDPKKVAGEGVPPNSYRARFVAQQSGELFLYVNDAVVGFPWLSSAFYKNNHGSAKISVRLL